MKPSGIVTLLTDFGLSDTYVGQMKGVILARAPGTVCIDLTHGIRPQAVEQGAFLLEQTVGAFVAGTVHLAVVDPGVGSERRALAVAAGGQFFVGPDNGLLSAILPEHARPSRNAAVVELPAGVVAVELTNPRHRRAVLSATFHGRDLFAPAAAFLAAGGAIAELGEPVGEVMALPVLRAEQMIGGMLRARVVHIDHFGNLVTSCRASDLSTGSVPIHLAGQTVRRLVRTYSDARAGELVALVGSGGFVELAVRNGSAAEQSGIQIGDEVIFAPSG